MQLGTISFFSLLLLLHLLLCLQQWIAGNFLTEWRKWVKPLICLSHSTIQIFFTILLILLKHMFTCMTYMMLESSTWSSFTGLDLLVFGTWITLLPQKPDLCSIGLGHSFALSLRKTIDKRCNSNLKKEQRTYHVQDLHQILTNLVSIWNLYWLPWIFMWSVYLMWPRRACASSSQPFAEPSPGILSRTQLSSFDATTWRFDSSNIIFSLAARSWKASPTNCQVSKRQTQEPCEASRKTCPNRISDFQRLFFFAWVQLLCFF